MLMSSQRPMLTVLGQLAVVVFFGCDYAPPSQTNADSDTPEASSGKAVVQRPTIELVKPPERQGKYTRYWISANLSAFDTLGIASPGGEKLKWLQPQGFSAESECIRQFRLQDGRHALAMYDDGYYYSLVLIYQPPTQKAGAKAKTAVSTKDGSLEAWLFRHEGHDHSEHYLPIDSWKNLLISSPEERKREPKSFRLGGSAKVREDQFGLVEEIGDVDLHSLESLPPFIEYLNFQEKEAEDMFKLDVQAADPRLAEAKERYQERIKKVAFWRKNKATEVAKIKGWVTAGWAPPLREMVWP